MKSVLIVGQSFSGLTSYLTRHGYDYVVLKDISATKYPDKKFKRRILADFSSPKTTIDSLDQLRHKPDAVICTYERYIVSASLIAKYFKLPGLPTEAALACTDKYLMRSLFANAPEKISPDFTEVKNEQTLKDFAKTHTFPLILKPANLAKSLLVTKSDNLVQLLQNYQRTLLKIEFVYQKYSPGRSPKIIVEEYLDGSIHSTDAFVDSAGKAHVMDQIVDYQTGYDIGYDDNFHYSRILPSKLSDDSQAEFLKCAELGCKALGMKNSPAHIEIIMTKDGPRIVEIGARNGGYRERMYRLANGIDIVGNALKLALGEQPNIQATKSEPCAVLELFPKTPGIFAGISHESELRSLPSLNYLSVKVKIGDFVGKAGDGYKMCAVVILHNSDVSQFAKDLDFVNKKVSAETRSL